MARFRKFVPQGVIPAALLPFHGDFSIDEQSFKSHMADLAKVKGISAITVNASTPEQFAAYIRAELAKWGKLIKQTGLRAE